MSKINYFIEDLAFALPTPRKTSAWIKKCFETEKKAFKVLNFIFCSDDYLRRINIQYLNHHTLTDIITFDQSEGVEIEGDVYISIERVTDNAHKYNVAFIDELHRVMIHGALHLMGYGDKIKNEKILMRSKEDACLSLR